MKKIALFIGFILTSILIFAQKTYNLEGKLGTYPIFMQIQEYDNDINGTYYYKSSLKDIVFKGIKSNLRYSFEVQSDYGKVAETFTLKKTGDKFTGSWKDSKGKTLAILLNPINTSNHTTEYSHIINKLKETDPYNYVRACYITLNRDSVTTYKDKSIVWFSEKYCIIPFFRLGNGFTKEQREKINPILDDIHINYIITQLGCSSSWSYNEGENISFLPNLKYLDSNLLGFEVFMSWYCGGAHPDFCNKGYLFDLKTGQDYDISDIYNLDAGILTKLVYDEYGITAPVDKDDVCDYTNTEYWEFPSWSITEKGVAFTPSFYRAARACEDSFLIPFSKLAPYKSRSFQYKIGL